MGIHYLVIDEQVRKLGYGKKLLVEAEKLAKEKEC
ncbi:GNAT family N-acetyltransferase [Paenibacillus thiaminolyticus]